MNTHPRWQQRAVSFDKALAQLRGPVEQGLASLSELERAGVVQLFELTIELGWKCLLELLRYEGVVVQPVTPRSVIKTASRAGLLDDADPWIDMLERRIVLAHTYSPAAVDRALAELDTEFMPALEALSIWLNQRRLL